MKFTITAKAFADALAAVTRVVEHRNTYPILANVYVTADIAGKVTLRATDLDIENTVTVEAFVQTAGVTTVPARTLEAVVKKYDKAADVSFETVSDEQALIKSGRSRVNLATLSPDSFPDLKSGNFSHRFELPAKDFAAAMARVAFAISTEETRWYLNGIYMHTITVANTLRLRMVATDGHRMARLEMPAPEGSENMPGIIVPRKTVGEFTRMCEGAGDAPAHIEVSDNKMRVTIDKASILSKLIEGTFPDYDRVTPKSSNHIALANRNELAKALDRVATLASDRGGKAVKFSMVDNALTLEVSNPDHGTATEEMAIQFDEAEPFEIGFNAKYLSTILDILGAGDVRLAVTDAGAPTVITKEGDPSFLTVLMPMRV